MDGYEILHIIVMPNLPGYHEAGKSHQRGRDEGCPTTIHEIQSAF